MSLSYEIWNELTLTYSEFRLPSSDQRDCIIYGYKEEIPNPGPTKTRAPTCPYFPLPPMGTKEIVIIYIERRNFSLKSAKKPCPYFSVGPNLGKLCVGVARVHSPSQVPWMCFCSVWICMKIHVFWDRVNGIATAYTKWHFLHHYWSQRSLQSVIKTILLLCQALEKVCSHLWGDFWTWDQLGK